MERSRHSRIRAVCVRCSQVGAGVALVLVRARSRLAEIGGTCVLPRFSALIRGIAISSVTWLLDGTRIRGRTVHRGTEYAAPIILSPGSHRLIVKVKFKTSTNSPAWIFKRTVADCLTSLPKFTG